MCSRDFLIERYGLTDDEIHDRPDPKSMRVSHQCTNCGTEWIDDHYHTPPEDCGWCPKCGKNVED
jgi:hypothetical protein